jgi:sugar phosphate isomerase/epimerase
VKRKVSPFRLSVITDEMTQDFEKACSIAANDFGLSWIEIRQLWGKLLSDLTPEETEKALGIMAKYKLRLTDYASPLFKVYWKDATVNDKGAALDPAKVKKGFDAQPELLERCIATCKTFKTERIRCFDFLRIPDQKPYRAAINDVLRKASERVAKEGLILVMENEPACNTGSGAEAGAVLAEVTNKNFMLNWDPGNSGMIGTPDVFPGDFDKIPFDRIGHCHCKDVGPKASGSGYEWRPVGKGTIDWVGQFKALKKGGYTKAVSMETHWHGPDGPEASTRVSIAGMFEDLRKAGCLEG